MLRNERGFSLLEIITASVIGALVAGGTMTVFVMSVKLARDASGQAEATQLAQQTIENFREKVACQQSGQTTGQTWFNESCAPAAPSGSPADALPSTSLEQSFVKRFGGTRTYTVVPADCDNDATNDCLKVRTTVRWTTPQ